MARGRDVPKKGGFLKTGGFTEIWKKGGFAEIWVYGPGRVLDLGLKGCRPGEGGGRGGGGREGVNGAGSIAFRPCHPPPVRGSPSRGAPRILQKI